MVTECYIASCFIGEVARCAVVIADDVRLKEVKTILHQVSWEVKEPWIYDGMSIYPDRLNCEILAACYALKWCADNKKQLVNIYAPIGKSQERYYRLRFPADRPFGNAYVEAYNRFCSMADALDGKVMPGRVFADWDITIEKLHKAVIGNLLNDR